MFEVIFDDKMGEVKNETRKTERKEIANAIMFQLWIGAIVHWNERYFFLISDKFFKVYGKFFHIYF